MGHLKTAISGDSILEYIGGVLTIKKIAKFLLLNDSPVAGHLWYLSAYLYVLVLFYFIDKFDKKKVTYVIIPLLLLIDLAFGKYSLLLWHREPNIIIVRNFLFVGLPYFLLGSWLRAKIDNGKIKVSNGLLLAGVVLFSLTTLLEKNILILFNVNATRDHYVSTTLLVLCFFVFLAKNPMLFRNSILEKIGRDNSLHIYIVHLIFVDIIYLLIPDKQNVLMYFAVFVVFFVSLACSITYQKIKGTLRHGKAVAQQR